MFNLCTRKDTLEMRIAHKSRLYAKRDRGTCASSDSQNFPPINKIVELRFFTHFIHRLDKIICLLTVMMCLEKDCLHL